ncbi:toll/interleukin-1 receptor domain-containing protein [Aeromonas sp. BIGb0445]|uniref:toll/interleukin-1 receptor domain-containing protein n=1 Tax=Aeromonas sp. BIGb0445 TaxID=2940593 RepID=UPI0021687ADE|nr:toll/interleukin-1 receptor domain-containing protein [Aeromonas sp. BIGb0445]MCS3458457.1 hypothetical protein [Aeromonas sp. BIGb0445]
MALIKESDLREKFGKVITEKSIVGVESYSEDGRYDIFLSHSYLDKVVVIYIKELFERLGYTVYVDWVDDNQLEREMVCEKTAAILRTRMKSCRCLFFAVSTNAGHSKWMPWECGYFDGINGKVAILPITSNDEATYKGQEYLGLYPYIDAVGDSVYINDPNIYFKFRNLRDWLDE